MKLAALIHGKKNIKSSILATANLANFAKDGSKQLVILPRLAGLATLAVATTTGNAISEDLPAFVIESTKIKPPVEASPCYSCHGLDFWRSPQGEKICRRCHPPAPGAEKVAATLPPVTTEEQLMGMVRATFAELDALRGWEGFRAKLSECRRQRVTEIEARIDSTYGALDREGLAAALADYREALTETSPPTTNQRSKEIEDT